MAGALVLEELKHEVESVVQRLSEGGKSTGIDPSDLFESLQGKGHATRFADVTSEISKVLGEFETSFKTMIEGKDGKPSGGCFAGCERMYVRHVDKEMQPVLVQCSVVSRAVEGLKGEGVSAHKQIDASLKEIVPVVRAKVADVKALPGRLTDLSAKLTNSFSNVDLAPIQKSLDMTSIDVQRKRVKDANSQVSWLIDKAVSALEDLSCLLEKAPAEIRSALGIGWCIPRRTADRKMGGIMKQLNQLSELKQVLSECIDPLKKVGSALSKLSEYLDGPFRDYIAHITECTSGLSDIIGSASGVTHGFSQGLVQGVESVASMISSSADPRTDFGIGFITRCSVCNKMSLNRGDAETRKVFCVKCYRARFA
eukprot:TRINITY_DN55726_c0_g1_i1.p1 TRINITY_DN55726_c0_g1~~TRINITY_DN55726_c0_g1_i1.p1  ORF type:complete len:369 (-),score=73.77 TRINITY_DN55726_c0_g1_i1:97-1203(-)